MKKLLAYILAIVTMFSLTSCSSGQSNTEDLDAKPANTVNFDLSQYKSHGSLSEGLIYVIKAADTAAGEIYDKFAYMDVDGNIIYGWETMPTYYDAGIDGLRGVYPQNFKNGLALIYDRCTYSVTFGFASCTVIDKTGNVVAQFYAKASEKSGTTNAVDVRYRTSDTEGYAFFYGMDSLDAEYGLYFINKTGTHRLPLYEIMGMTIDYIEVLNGKYVYVPIGQYQLYDNEGALILDIDDTCGFTPLSIKIFEDKYVEVTYEKDEEYYVSVVDFNGTEIKPAVLEKDYVSEFTSQDVASVEYGAESIEELIQVIEDLSVSNCYKYVTNLTFFYQLDSDETMIDCLMNPQRNIRTLSRETNDRLARNENYYYSEITVTDYKESSTGREYIENNYQFAFSDLDKIEGAEKLKAEFKKEFEGIEEVYELRGEITSKRSNNNSNMAKSSTYKLSQNYYENEIELPFIFKINGRYYFGFLWC